MVIYYFRSMPLSSIKCVNLEDNDVVRVSEVRARYPSAVDLDPEQYIKEDDLL